MKIGDVTFDGTAATNRCPVDPDAARRTPS